MPSRRRASARGAVTATVITGSGLQARRASAASYDVVDDSDPPGDASTTEVLAPDTLYTGYIPSAGDVDAYRIHAPAAGSVVTVSLSNLPADEDLFVQGPKAGIPVPPSRRRAQAAAVRADPPLADQSVDLNGDDDDAVARCGDRDADERRVARRVAAARRLQPQRDEGRERVVPRPARRRRQRLPRDRRAGRRRDLQRAVRRSASPSRRRPTSRTASRRAHGPRLGRARDVPVEHPDDDADADPVEPPAHRGRLPRLGRDARRQARDARDGGGRQRRGHPRRVRPDARRGACARRSRRGTPNRARRARRTTSSARSARSSTGCDRSCRRCATSCSSAATTCCRRPACPISSGSRTSASRPTR